MLGCACHILGAVTPGHKGAAGSRGRGGLAGEAAELAVGGGLGRGLPGGEGLARGRPGLGASWRRQRQRPRGPSARAFLAGPRACP